MTIISLMLISGLSMLISMQKHALTILLTIEFILLSSLLLLSTLTKLMLTSPLIIMTFLTMIACEGALGLSLIVTIVRFSGNDSISSNSLIKCSN